MSASISALNTVALSTSRVDIPDELKPVLLGLLAVIGILGFIRGVSGLCNEKLDYWLDIYDPS